MRGKLLIASNTLEDANFAGTIILIARHDADGAMGVVINRPLGLSLDYALRGEVEAARGVEAPLFHGGPCTGQLVAVHNVEALARAEQALGYDDEDPENDDDEEPWAEPITPGVWFCTRREALEALMRHLHGSDQTDKHAPAVKFAAGYAGWGPGQLEAEVNEGSWLLAEGGFADIYAGATPAHPLPAPTVSLPPGSIGVLAALRGMFSHHDPTPALASGLRQWVRLYTKTNLSRFVNPDRIPEDPSVN